VTITVFIDGAAGTTGLDIAERLAGRSELSLIVLDEERRKQAAARRQAFGDADFAILCLPDAAAREAVTLAEGTKARIIDASSAHRVAAGWTFGFAEMAASQRAAIAGATKVTNPGCYSTGFIALIAPLVQRGLLPADGHYSCNAVSGYSGGGKALISRFEDDEPDIAWRGYALSIDHKHVPEMQVRSGLGHEPLFAPAVVPAFRGMVVEVPLIRAMDARIAPSSELRAALIDHYAGSPIVGVGDLSTGGEMLLRQGAAPSDRLMLDVFANAADSHLRLVAMLDNLGKGAGGACVQNLNIMADLPETAGLRL
jgi:N-acetyl-gamma-glutamyl-phosphate reductase